MIKCKIAGPWAFEVAPDGSQAVVPKLAIDYGQHAVGGVKDVTGWSQPEEGNLPNPNSMTSEAIFPSDIVDLIESDPLYIVMTTEVL